MILFLVLSTGKFPNHFDLNAYCNNNKSERVNSGGGDNGNPCRASTATLSGNKLLQQKMYTHSDYACISLRNHVFTLKKFPNLTQR